MLSVPAISCCSESPLVEVAFQAIARGDLELSPFVIVGPNAAGLSEWIALAISERLQVSSNVNVQVLNGKDFARAVGLAATTDTLVDFRERMDRADVLVLEMVEPVADDSATSRELSSLLDRAQYLSQEEPGRCLIVTTLRLPNQTAGWPASLASRLLQGLSVSITTPPRRLREARLRTRLAPWFDLLPSSLINQWMQSPCAALADWEQTLDALVQTLSEQGEALDPDSLEQLPAVSNATQVDSKQILKTVAKMGDMRLADIKGSSRRRSTVLARSVAIYLLRHLTNLSLESIGKLVGNRDHTTVLHSFRKITEQRGQDLDAERLIDRVCRELNVDPPAIQLRDSNIDSI